MIQLGGADIPSIEAFWQLPNLMFISERVDNNDVNIHKFLIKRYFENGAALFGRESIEDLQDFRVVCNGGLDDMDDTGVYEIIQYFVCRLRNIAHFGSLKQAAIKNARIVSFPKPRADVCKFNENKIIDVSDCIDKINEIYSKSPSDQGIILNSTNFEFPPFYKLCRCRVEGLIAGIDY